MITSEQTQDLLKTFAPAFSKQAARKNARASFDATRFARAWKDGGELFWRKAGEVRALALFRAASERIPAYRDFLKKHSVRATSIKTIQDFSSRVPLTTKENYIAEYPLASRLWDGDIASANLIAVSSGTSGEPNFWPRSAYQEFEAAAVHEVLYRSLYEIDRYKTLLLVAFPVGIYVSGVATLIPSFAVASKGYPLTVIAVGNQKQEVVRAMKHLAPHYEQVIIAGHPFFIKDVLESAQAEHIGMPKRLKTFMCSEGFSEVWRSHVSRSLGMQDPAGLLSTYGSSELLLMGYESPLTVAVRNSDAFKQRFTKRLHTPSLFQYNPFLRYIESVNGELVFTAESGVPLIRFNMHDSGETVSFADMQQLTGFSYSAKDPAHWKLPFVTLHGRSDQTLVFYAANIYPEHIKAGLDHPEFMNHLTGKFVMRKEYSKSMDQNLEVHVELRAGAKKIGGLAKKIQRTVLAALHSLNMEYKDASSRIKKNLAPRVKLWTYQHKKHFPVGVKPKYISKQ